MNTLLDKIENWLSSKEIKAQMKISGCELMHLREAGELEFKKVGNGYLYKLPNKFSDSNVTQ
jgi:hypothetical protein